LGNSPLGSRAARIFPVPSHGTPRLNLARPFLLSAEHDRALFVPRRRAGTHNIQNPNSGELRPSSVSYSRQFDASARGRHPAAAGDGARGQAAGREPGLLLGCHVNSSRSMTRRTPARSALELEPTSPWMRQPMASTSPASGNDNAHAGVGQLQLGEEPECLHPEVPDLPSSPPERSERPTSRLTSMSLQKPPVHDEARRLPDLKAVHEPGEGLPDQHECPTTRRRVARPLRTMSRRTSFVYLGAALDREYGCLLLPQHQRLRGLKPIGTELYDRRIEKPSTSSTFGFVPFRTRTSSGEDRARAAQRARPWGPTNKLRQPARVLRPRGRRANNDKLKMPNFHLSGGGSAGSHEMVVAGLTRTWSGPRTAAAMGSASRLIEEARNRVPRSTLPARLSQSSTAPAPRASAGA